MAGPPPLLIEAFEARFHSTPEVFRAPGRVNLIGEHTDYNLGFVLPIAIDFACYAASAPNQDDTLRVFSLNMKDQRSWPIAQVPSLKPAPSHWTNYILGVARQIPQTHGRDIALYSTVPVGSGLSSSAALEVAMALAAGWDLQNEPKLDLAKLCQRAENDFVGLPSGIMDQYVSVFGEAGAAIQIDCRSLKCETVPLPPQAAFVAVDSLVKHELGQSAYRERVADCARAARDLHVDSLREASVAQLPLIRDPIIRRRARHVLTENQRVLAFAQASRTQDLVEMGRLFTDSHRSLQKDYEVSCPEIDFLVDSAIALPGVYGARITGGGFGGCTVNLMEPGVVESFEAAIQAAYRKRFGSDPLCYRVQPAAGASKLT